MKYLNALLTLLLILVFHTGASAQLVSTSGTYGPAACDGYAYIGNTSSLTSWSWTDNLGNPITSGLSYNGDTLYNLCQGNYVLNYVDSSGSGSEAFTIGLNTCYGFSATMTTTAANANACDGTATISITGGVAPYTIDVYQGGGGLPMTIIIGGSGTINSLCEGYYYIVITDANGCSAYTNGTVAGVCSGFNVTVTQANETSVGSCDGLAAVSASGGVSPYSFAWSNGSTTSTISNLCAGYYYVMVTDANGCTDSVYANISNPCAGLSVYASIMSNSDSLNCNGAISVQAYGGTPNYSYQWNNGVAGPYISNLCAGTYQVTVTDSNGCSITNTYVLYDSIPGGPCASLGITMTTTNTSGPVFCDGTVTFNPYGGTPPYLFTLDGGATFSPITTITGLCSGVYTAVVLDANGCTASGSFYIGNDTLPNGGSNLVGYVYTIDESLSGACDGSAETYVFGGIPPYQYYYSTGSTTYQEDNLCAGIYNVIVVDGNYDTLFLDFLIVDPGNVIINTPFPDSTVVDSLFNNLVANCTIDYGTLDSAFIYNSNLLSADSITITWAIYDTNGVQYITQTYYIGGGGGVYTFVLSVYCPQKSTPDYLKVFDQLYVDPNALGISDPEAPEAIVYPNPFTGSVQVQFGMTGDYNLKLCDIAGRQLLEKEVSNSDFTELNNLEHLAGGEYLLFITGQGQTAVRKLIK